MKKTVFLLVLLFFAANLYSQVFSKYELVPANSWVYDALYAVSAEQGVVPDADIGPCSVEELNMYFSKLSSDGLTESGKVLYERLKTFFSDRKKTLDFSGIGIGAEIVLYPEVLYKSNDEIDWTYGSKESVTYDYKKYETAEDGHLELKDSEPKTEYYFNVSNWANNKLTQPLGSLALNINFGDFAFIHTKPFFTNSAVTMIPNGTWSNIPSDFNAFEFMQPTDAYFSTGHVFDNGIGIGFKIGKEGAFIGRSLNGSCLYNSTFQTDMYMNLALYSSDFKYQMDVVEVDHSKFLYLHNVEFKPKNWFKFSVTEGCQISDSFELRYLNPLMLMHSFHSWTEYRTDDEYDIYRASRVASYLGFTFDVVPFRNFRLYGIYSQIEIQTPPELKSAYGRQLPTSFALQLGAEYALSLPDSSRLTLKGEGLFSCPFMYYKTGADWSLIRSRNNVYNSRYEPLYSWIGTPFGPDAAGFELKASYDDLKKLKVDFGYLFMAKGTNDFNRFFEKCNIDGKDYWTYYPSTKIDGKYVVDSSVARSFALIGLIEYKNQFTLDCSYKITDQLKFDAQLVYSLILNNNHIKNNFEQGIQLALALEYKMF